MTDEKNVAPLASMQQELCDMWGIDNQTKNVFYYDEREAFVIECADNVEDASNGVLEDGDLYYLNILEEEMLCKLRKDIVAYYME